ncbi:hypothetical protein [Hymenobacter terricola]|uniref:hypothetical protein n=1 Tax=Hymenobacter terricola TaxID=2819236 RepID=UPI001B3057C5|nr:hypothetical protein [Hymenobacter terricola]
MGGCTLYQPLLTTLPAVREAGEVAAAGNWQFPQGVQGSVIVSPVSHALLFASGGLNGYNTERDSSKGYARTRQFETGIGGYIALKQAWLSASVGAGRARGYRYGRFDSDGLNVGVLVPVPGGGSGGRPIPVPELLGYYTTRFAQATIWWPDARKPSLEWGATLRVNQVRFADLTLNGVAQPLPAQYYLQTSVVAQQHLWRRLSWQATASYDFAVMGVTDKQAFPSAPLRVGVGLAFCPVKPN